MSADVLVVGGGLAGAAAARLLAAAGRDVRVSEREPGPHHKVCGEFLSIEGVRELERLGLPANELGPMPIDRVRVVHGGRAVEAALPFVAQGLSRKVLDAVLLEHAAAAGAEVRYGEKLASLDGVDAAAVLLATGKHDVRGVGRDDGSARSDAHVGLKMHFGAGTRVRAKLARTVELYFFDGGYAGLHMVGEDTANLCLALRKGRFRELGGRWEDVLAMLLREPILAARLEDAEALLPKPMTIANLPYGFVARDMPADSRLFRLGDQVGMTGSLTGDGMAAALRTGRMAAEAVIAGEGSFAYQRRAVDMVAPQIGRAMTLQRLAEVGALRRVGMGVLAAAPGLLTLLAKRTRLAANGIRTAKAPR